MAGDQLERGTVGLRDSAVGAADFGRVFVGEQGGVPAGDGQTRSAVFEGCAHAVVEPVGSAVEADIGGEAVAHQGGFVVGVERGDERCAGSVGLLGDAAGKRQHIERSRHDQLLAFFEPEADADGYFGETIQFCFVGAI